MHDKSDQEPVACNSTVNIQDMTHLMELNRQYVAAVQKGDAKHFEEILAEDFMCSNPDGTICDRADFLKMVVNPPPIKELTADEVSVRVLGDFAIIHARISYRTSDGKQLFGRYTDDWARRDGRWLAVSAQTTASGW